MARRGYGVAGVAALAIGAASLVLANQVSTGAAHRGAQVALYLSFLVAIFTLLGVTVASSDRVVEERLAAGPHWSLRAACGRGFGRGAAGTRAVLMNVTRAAAAGAASVRGALNTALDAIPDDRRRALERAGYRTLVALGLVEADLRPEPVEAAEPAISRSPWPQPGAPHPRSTRRVASYRPRDRQLASRRRAALRRITVTPHR